MGHRRLKWRVLGMTCSKVGTHAFRFLRLRLSSLNRSQCPFKIEEGISEIPRSQAAQLANRTLPWPGDEENYIVSLDIFHVLVRVPA